MRGDRLPWALVAVLGMLSVPTALLASWARSFRFIPTSPPCFGLGVTCDLDASTTGAVVLLSWLLVSLGVALLVFIAGLLPGRSERLPRLVAAGGLTLSVIVPLVLGVIWLNEVFV